MKAVVLPRSFFEEMEAHARETYPDECCGFLFGEARISPAETERTILALERARNEFDGERRRRFLIPPEELREVERRAEVTGRAVVGFYHSHPDHPAKPSLFDQEHAWPWYSYIVLSVTASATPAVGAFELDPEAGEFREVRLTVRKGRAPSVAMVEGLPRT